MDFALISMVICTFFLPNARFEEARYKPKKEFAGDYR